MTIDEQSLLKLSPNPDATDPASLTSAMGNTLPPWASPKSVTDLVGAKTISSAKAYRHGIVTVLELTFSDSSTNRVKVSGNGLFEIGGTADMGTGTAITW